MIWRDDDILELPRTLPQLLRADDLIRKYGQRHTIAIIAETLTPELAEVIKTRGMSAQLHCWSHDDLSVDLGAIAQLPAAVAKIEQMVGVRPMVLYPPWNRTSPTLEGAAAKLGLRVSWRKLSLEQYIRAAGDVEEDTINFHYWHDSDMEQLEPALRIAARA